jgi:hypothetical protein
METYFFAIHFAMLYNIRVVEVNNSRAADGQSSVRLGGGAGQA